MPDTPIRKIVPQSDYADKLIKLIPGEIVAAYMAIDGLIPPDSRHTQNSSIIVAVVLFAIIPFYLRRLYAVTSVPQIIFTMLSFVVWLYSLGGPFKYFRGPDGDPIHVPWIGSIILILWGVAIPLLYKADNGDSSR